MKMTYFQHILLMWLECLGAVTVTVLAIILVSLFIVAIEDIIKGKHDLF